MCAHVPWMVMNVIFTYTGRDFAVPAPILLPIHSRVMGREVAIEDRDNSIAEYFDILNICCSKFTNIFVLHVE